MYKTKGSSKLMIINKFNYVSIYMVKLRENRKSFVFRQLNFIKLGLEFKTTDHPNKHLNFINIVR